MPEPISNDEFVKLMKEAWQGTDRNGRNELFTVLEEVLGTNNAVKLKNAMQVSL